MQSMCVSKIVAQDDNVEVVESSIEEFQHFLTGLSRPDFENTKVLCVKFCFSILPNSLEDAEETSWFINECAVKVPLFFYSDAYGPKMPAELPPFLLALYPSFTGKRNVFDEYQRFYNMQEEYELDSLSDEEKIKAFLEWIESHPYELYLD